MAKAGTCLLDNHGGLHMCGSGNGTIRRCGLVGVGVALLEWVWPCWRKCVTVGAGFEVSYVQAMPSVEQPPPCCLQIKM